MVAQKSKVLDEIQLKPLPVHEIWARRLDGKTYRCEVCYADHGATMQQLDLPLGDLLRLAEARLGRSPSRLTIALQNLRIDELLRIQRAIPSEV